MIQCKNCKKKIPSNTNKVLVWCGCVDESKRIGVDGCENYTRILGNNENYNIIDEHFDKEINL